MLGIDYGARRIGLAVSDHTKSLARPWQTIPAGASPKASAEAVAALLAGTSIDEQSGADGIEEIVVGLPRRLNGDDTHQTQTARAFATALGTITGFSVHLQDERLTSHEAESRLAEREKDWRRRKQQLDAAAAAVILQDYLDRG